MSGIHRLLSKREKRAQSPTPKQPFGIHLTTSQHNISTPSSRSTELVNPDSVADFYGLFCDSSKPSHTEEQKIKSLRQKLIASKSVLVKAENILYALKCDFSKGDADAAYSLLGAMTDASEGIIIAFDPKTKLLGAINRQAVTCYLDSTLFAMFSRLDSFEAMLYNTFDDRPRNRLGFLLRLWVNLLRAGKLITTDVTKAIQEALAECGWKDASSLHQQDASEAFTFITERLKLPLLTLKMDMFHAGKRDEDDHRFINERLLEVAIPAGENGEHRDIKLEDCLEDYFNNRIEVRRFLERRTTLSSVTADSMSKSNAIHVETIEVEDSDTPITPISPIPTHVTSPRPGNRSRATSIIQERFVPDQDDKTRPPRASGDIDKKTNRRRKGSVRKEVLMPAWQFFSLIPWYTNNAPSTDAQVAQHFSSKRPILGLCLKRYSMTPSGRAMRLDTFVDIPVEIGLPHFIQDDKMDDDGPIYGNFKLSLQSVVCHRGNSVDSGHYISLVRANTLDPTADRGNWMRFDDLATQRIVMTDIQKALRDETPYLLFYQIIPVDGDPGNLLSGEQPPSYTESQHDSGVSGVSASPEFARVMTEDSESLPPSGRPSFDLQPLDNQRSTITPDRKFSIEQLQLGDYRTTLTPGGMRRPSTIVIAEALNSSTKSSSRSTSQEPKDRRQSTSISRSLSRGNRRLSATLASLAGVGKSKEDKMKSNIPEPSILVEDHGTPEDALARLNGEVPSKTSGSEGLDSEHRGRGHSRKRDKSKNRLSKVYMGRPKGGRPDRECSVM